MGFIIIDPGRDKVSDNHKCDTPDALAIRDLGLKENARIRCDNELCEQEWVLARGQIYPGARKTWHYYWQAVGRTTH